MWNAIFNRFSLSTVLVLYILVPLLFAMAAISYLGLRGMENNQGASSAVSSGFINFPILPVGICRSRISCSLLRRFYFR